MSQAETRISLAGVLIGGVATLVIAACVALLVMPFFDPWVRYMDPIVVVGFASVVASLLRAMAGIFAGRAYRARHVVYERTDYLLTGALAGALGWLLWSLLVLAMGDSQMFTTFRGLAELPRWMVEVAIGSLLVGTDPPTKSSQQVRRYRSTSTVRS